MFNPKLDIAFWNYDRTNALADGSVKIANADATFHTAPIITPIFEGVMNGKFVFELGMTYFLRTFENGESPFVAIQFSRISPSATLQSTSTRRAAYLGLRIKRQPSVESFRYSDMLFHTNSFR